MKSTLVRHSIRRKLVLLLTTTAAAAVAVASFTLCVYQWQYARKSLFHQELAFTAMTAENIAPALLFNDSKAAQETLDSLKADPRIAKACVYTRKNTVAASFPRSPEPAKVCPEDPSSGPQFTFHRLTLVKSLSIQGDTVGQLYVEISLQETFALLARLVEAGILATLGATVLAFFLSSKTAKWVSDPIVQLTETALQISDRNDFHLRASRRSDDEVGLLIDQFNSMLDKLHLRDAELRSSYDLLELKVEERTKTLQQEIRDRKLIEQDLVAAKQLAEESNQAKSQFLANMSHELRTPLNAIVGYSEMLYEEAEENNHRETLEDLSKVLSSARHLRSLISDILDLSKIEAGKMEIHLDHVLAASVLPALLGSAEVLAQKNRNKLETRYDLHDQWVNIETLRLSQCLLNLISNACKFTEDGLVTLTVSQRERDQRDWIVWAVQDTGPGITPEDQRLLFTRFTQVDASAKRRHGGTGLGLCISQQLCEAMAGTIEVVSELGRGSTFSIWIPVVPAVCFSAEALEYASAG